MQNRFKKIIFLLEIKCIMIYLNHKLCLAIQKNLIRDIKNPNKTLLINC